MTDVHASSDTIQSWSSRLAGAADELEAAGQNVPEPPNVGRCGAVVAFGLSRLCDALASVSDGMNAAGQAVGNSASTYDQTDDQNAEDIGKVGGH